ncbi:hypothetical protein L0Y49_02235 [bacterium]|nr:hypothetical protein [bacterium]MCI0680138.1 hypothetical protein [bacterium]
MPLTNEQLKKKIMHRIYTVYVIRKLLSVKALRLYGLILLAGIGLAKVSVKSVLANMPDMADMSALGTFYWTAIQNTEFAVKIAILYAFGVLLWLIRDIFVRAPQTRYAAS